ncbi:MAG: hypothetical protein R2813_02880 [Flavobacteriales bacterium]
MSLFINSKTPKEMPNYCQSVIEVNSVPSFPSMELFQPYFEVPDDCTSIQVFVKVPSECYYIASDSAAAPAGGPCGDPGDLQNCINLNQRSGCQGNTPQLLQITLNYSEDPNGAYLIIYAVDLSDSSSVKAGGKTKKKVFV